MAADVCGLLLELDCGAHHVSFNCQQAGEPSIPPALYMLLHDFCLHLVLLMTKLLLGPRLLLQMPLV